MEIQASTAAQDAIAGASEVLNRLRGAFAFATKNNSKTIFYSRSRVKDPGSITEKLFDRRSRYGGENYSIRNITDIVGYRLVVLYDDQLEAAFKLALQVLRNCFQSEDPLITDRELWADIHEIKFFPRSPSEDDPYHQLYRCVLSNPEMIGQRPPDLEDKVKEAQPVDAAGSTSAYSSMHLIVYARSYSLGAPKVVPLELQIRTAIEDVWSEISHENEYKIRKRNAWSPQLGSLYESNSKGIKSLKRQLNSVVPDAVIDIRRNTKSVANELDKLKFNPVAQYSSYVLNLAYHIGAGVFTKDQRDQFEKYERCIELIKAAHLQRHDPNELERLLAHFARAKKIIVSIASIAFDDAICQQSFAGLIRLEGVRLNAIEIRILKTCKAPLDDAQQEELLRRADDLYAELDHILLDETIRLKPISMIEYFKYYVFRYSSHPKLDILRDHLDACYSALKIDPTVDQDGMNVVMATRAFARTFWDIAEEYRSHPSRKNSAHIVSKMREHYISALRLALESRETYERRARKDRGKVDDLIFSTSPFQEQSCTNNVVMYAADCILNGVSVEAFSEIKYGLKDLANDLKALMAFLETAGDGHEDIWHSALIGFRALAKAGQGPPHHVEQAQRIARLLAGDGTRDLSHQRIRQDAQEVLEELGGPVAVEAGKVDRTPPPGTEALATDGETGL